MNNAPFLLSNAKPQWRSFIRALKFKGEENSVRNS